MSLKYDKIMLPKNYKACYKKPTFRITCMDSFLDSIVLFLI